MAEIEVTEDIFGQAGFDEITATETGNWYAIQPIGGSATLAATGRAGDSLSSVTLAEGNIVYGRFNAIAVSSGTVLAYKRVI